MNNENDSKQSKIILYYNAPISDRKKEEEDSTPLQVISSVGNDKLLVKHQKLTVPCYIQDWNIRLVTTSM